MDMKRIITFLATLVIASVAYAQTDTPVVLTLKEIILESVSRDSIFLLEKMTGAPTLKNQRGFQQTLQVSHMD